MRSVMANISKKKKKKISTLTNGKLVALYQTINSSQRSIVDRNIINVTTPLECANFAMEDYRKMLKDILSMAVVHLSDGCNVILPFWILFIAFVMLVFDHFISAHF